MEYDSVMHVRSRLLIAGLSLLAAAAASGGAGAAPKEHDASPPHHVLRDATPTYQGGYAPSQLWNAYGFSGLSCAAPGTNTCGSGQTIAIVDAYNDPSAESHLATFASQVGLPACTGANGCFTKATRQGPPHTNAGWALEISRDA